MEPYRRNFERAGAACDRTPRAGESGIMRYGPPSPGRGRGGVAAPEYIPASVVHCRPLSVLVACEFSGTVSGAFRRAGHDAWSCDLLPTEGDPCWHFQEDMRLAIKRHAWDIIIIHIECTRMAVCGNATWAGTQERQDAVDNAVTIWELAREYSDHVAMENPASVLFPALRQHGADVQYIQPWQHGHAEQKKTGLALWGVPRLKETVNVYEEMMLLPRKERERIHFMSPSPMRGHERSRFFPGIADAMASQWGEYINHLHSLNL